MFSERKISDWLKTAVMHPLQERVVGLGVCPKCHTKTLRPKYEAEGMQFNQCDRCFTVYVVVGT
jgi:ssDNA-binding Zn-finger/Zn-ribbon topoisomerase 1